MFVNWIIYELTSKLTSKLTPELTSKLTSMLTPKLIAIFIYENTFKASNDIFSFSFE